METSGIKYSYVTVLPEVLKTKTNSDEARTIVAVHLATVFLITLTGFYSYY